MAHDGCFNGIEANSLDVGVLLNLFSSNTKKDQDDLKLINQIVLSSAYYYFNSNSALEMTEDCAFKFRTYCNAFAKIPKHVNSSFTQTMEDACNWPIELILLQRLLKLKFHNWLVTIKIGSCEFVKNKPAANKL